MGGRLDDHTGRHLGPPTGTTDTAAKSARKEPLTGKFRFNLVATDVEVIATSFATVMQAALIPVAYSVGTDFKPAVRATRWSTGTVVGRLGGNQDLPALPSETSSPRWQGMRQFAVVGASDAPWSQ